MKCIKILILVGLLLVLIWISAACRLLPDDDHSGEYDPALVNERLVYDGVGREVLLYVPHPLPEAGVPLVIMLHGSGGTPNQVMEGTTGGRWNELAFREKFIVAYPGGWNRSWNDCRGDIDNPPTTQDDLGFIISMIEWLAERYPVDPNQVFVAGHSNGGMMAMRLALEAPGSFAAVFANNGPLADKSVCDAPPESPISVLFLAATDDPLIPYEGGTMGLVGEDAGSVLSAEETVQTCLDYLDITSEPEVSDLPDRMEDDGSTVTRFVYEGEGVSLWYYRVNGGGHAWPGGEPFSIIEGQTNGAKNRDINGADIAWAFFQQFMK